MLPTSKNKDELRSRKMSPITKKKRRLKGEQQRTESLEITDQDLKVTIMNMLKNLGDTVQDG